MNDCPRDDVRTCVKGPVMWNKKCCTITMRYLPSTASSFALILFTYASLAAGKSVSSLALEAFAAGRPTSLAKACRGEIISYKTRVTGKREKAGQGGESWLAHHHRAAFIPRDSLFLLKLPTSVSSALELNQLAFHNYLNSQTEGPCKLKP